MAYDEHLADRVREVMDVRWDERKMFGGLCFMVNGNMALGIVGDELMVRVGKERFAETLAKPHAREMDFTGRPSAGMVYVAKPGFKDKRTLRTWVKRGVEHARSLPAKKRKA